ncbi:hypothetical protein BV25DRAFT_1803596 [Artomyces pyxidatus]|uniref:Uncharacterized protein n=1 Tax=Artomyces pyxidatus TaxID=48021 RepID=A0ACB8T3S0_9AGAM|nr:hypothetical protein BV25DRAFT_1803596 [Artomyces pyxidatus]
MPPSGPSQAPSAKVYSIRSDIHYSTATNTMTAMLELPGVKRGDLNIALVTEPYSKLRQVVVSGTSRPVFGEHEQEERDGRARAVHERRFGDFMRRYTVPFTTQAHDIGAQMQDGILILSIFLGPSISIDPPQTINIG